MKLSILIPMYNASNFICNCLDSLINQDLPKEDYEVLIIDDGSTDDSYKVASDYVRLYSNFLLFSKRNTGESSTRNQLLKLAKGDYIYNLDADDYIVYNSLNQILETAIKYDVDVFGFNTRLTDSFKEKELINAEVDIQIQTGINYIKRNRNLRHEVWWYIIKRSFLEETKLTFGTYEFNADVVFTLSLLLKANKFIFYSKSIHRYVQTPNSVIRSKNLIKRRIGIDNMCAMIVNYSKLISSVENQKYSADPDVINNLKFRRDVFSFFTIIKIIKYGLGTNDIKRKISELKEAGAYPIKNFNLDKYNSFKYKFLVKILNNRSMVSSSIILIRATNIFRKKSI